MRNIVIYTGPGCAYCEQAKELMKQHDLQFVEKNLADSGIIDEFRARLPRSKALPQIFIDDNHIGSLEDLRSRLHSGKNQ